MTPPSLTIGVLLLSAGLWMACDPNSQAADSAGSDAGSGEGANRGGGQGGGQSGGRQRGPTPVAIAHPSTRTLIQVINATGSLQAEQIVEVASDLPGRITTLDVELGQTIEQDAVLATLDDTELRQRRSEARAQLRVASAQQERAQVEVDNAQADVERNRSLVDRGLVTQQEFDSMVAQAESAQAALDVAEAQRDAADANADTAESNLDKAEVHAPFAGRIAAVYVDAGSVISAGTPLVRLVSSDRLALTVPINETEIGRLRLGQTATIHLTAFPSQTLAGHVARMGAQVNPADRSVAVEVALEPSELTVIDGMSGGVEIQVAEVDGALSIPVEAVVDFHDGGRGVWVHRDGQAFPVSPELGLSDGHFIEVLSGLSEGDDVIVRGQNQLREGGAVAPREVE